MAKVAITESYLEDIADAIRAKTGLSTTYKPSQMATAISSIPSGGGIIPTGTIQITSNNTYDVTQYASAAVNVPTGGTINNQDKTVSPSESQQTVEADSGYTGLGTVTVNAISSSYVGSGITRRTSSDLTVNGDTITTPSGYYSSSASQSVTSGTAGTPTATKGSVSNNSISVTPSVTNTTGYITGSTKTGTAVSVSASELVSGNKEITANGTNIDVTNYATVSVSVPGGGTINNQDKSVSPTESEQEVTYDSGYTGLGTVTIGAISSTYIGSGITQRSQSDLTASGATVTVPSGYYSSQATKSVTTMSLPTAASASATSGYTSKATISRSTSDQYINIPPGYNSAGGYYKISAVANGSATGPSSLSGSSATVTTGTNTITLTKTGVSTTPTVSAGYISSATSSTATVALTASVTTKAAATYNTSSSDQTIASGTYLTGTQTIKAVTVSGLSADKILSGTTVKIGDANDDDRIASVSGSVTLTTVYTGSSAPSGSLGSNNDIYIQS